MDQLIPTLAQLVAPFRDCFRIEVFQTFQVLIAGWIVCLGPHTISAVWQATGLAAKRHHDTAYAVFHSAAWEWDDLGIVLATLILAHLVPGGVVWIVVDDTLCHKRGARVAFGGIFLDAVLSSRRHKTFRFGLNWVVLGIAVPVPLRPDRYFCLPVLWRLYRKKGQDGYQTRPQAAAALARELAEANPERTFWLVGDSAYINAATLQGRPKNLQVIGPLPWKAALYGLPEPPRQGQRGRRRKKGERLPAPVAMIADTAAYPADLMEIAFPKVTRELRVQVIRDVLWYRGSKTEPVMVVLVRDPLGQWRDEALVATDPGATAAFVILGYCRRWSVELCFFDSKQFLGLHEPRVWSERSVERAHPMAWFVGSLTILWYCLGGHEGSHVERDRPWYEHKVTPTFTDMLGALRLQMWEYEVYGESGEEPPSPECVRMLLHRLSAVA
ncbi:MAG: transposase [Planctomycetaceae bacterium]|nr:transposase [Planctomycetaceae bacterium]